MEPQELLEGLKNLSQEGQQELADLLKADPETELGLTLAGEPLAKDPVDDDPEKP